VEEIIILPPRPVRRRREVEKKQQREEEEEEKEEEKEEDEDERRRKHKVGTRLFSSTESESVEEKIWYPPRGSYNCENSMSLLKTGGTFFVQVIDGTISGKSAVA